VSGLYVRHHKGPTWPEADKSERVRQQRRQPAAFVSYSSWRGGRPQFAVRGAAQRPAFSYSRGGGTPSIAEESSVSDWASRLAVAIEQVAVARLAEDESAPQNGPPIVRAHG
jgi:hypothetical protein